MAIPVICPGCDADYSVPENLLGKSIRCKKCGESIAVKKAARPAARVAVDDDDDVRPRKAVSRRRDDDEEDFDRDEPRTKKKGGFSPILIGGIAAVLLAAGVVGGIFAFGGSTDEVVKNENAPPSPGRERRVTPPPDATEGAPIKKDEPKTDEKKEEPKAEPAKNDEKKEEPKAEETKADEPKKEEPKAEKKDDKKADDAKTAKKDPPKANGATSTTDRPVDGMVTAPGGSLNGLSYERYRSGDMDPVTLKMVKNASVYIFAESEGGAGTGSGWFGIEPGLVFTNAHVLHMTAPNAPPPKQIKFYLNSGTPEQRMIPHSKIKILAVDRDIDLAVLQVINEPDLPPPLKVRPSLECMEGLKLSTVGYPFGARPGSLANNTGEPTVSIRPTSITSFKFNDMRQIRRIQLEGGANPGNSGGPVVDAEGSVCTVIVQGFHGTGSVVGGIALTFGVPTEYCFGILAGRLAEIEPSIAYKDGDKVRIPIRIKCLDPLNRLQSVGVASWIGNPPASDSKRYRYAGKEKPKTEPGDRDYSEIMLKYDNKTKIATGEIVLPKKPDGTVYWIQPFYTNPIVSRYYDAGMVYTKTSEPADRAPANMTFRNGGKTRVVTMTTASTRGEEAEGEGEAQSQRRLIRFGLTASESMLPADANDPIQGAKLRLNLQSLLMPQVVNSGKGQDALPKLLYARLNEEAKKCGGVALVNKEGVVYKHVINAVNVPAPVDKYYLTRFAGTALSSLEETSIKMPNKVVNPDETWTWTKDHEEIFQDPPPTDEEGNQLPNTQIPAPRKYRYLEERTYKYVGTRTREGRTEAMVVIEGKMSKAPGTNYGATGAIRGWAAIDVDSGVVLDATVEKDFEIDTSAKGVKKHAYGVMVYRITRSSPSN